MAGAAEGTGLVSRSGRGCAKLTGPARQVRAGVTMSDRVVTGRGAAWLARRSGGPKAASSNLAVPTT